METSFHISFSFLQQFSYSLENGEKEKYIFYLGPSVLGIKSNRVIYFCVLIFIYLVCVKYSFRTQVSRLIQICIYFFTIIILLYLLSIIELSPHFWHSYIIYLLVLVSSIVMTFISSNYT